LFPLAHAVVDAENDNNWLWFLQLLLTVVQSHALQSLVDKALVFLSDRQKGLLKAVDIIFPGCPHGYCLKHLEANFHKEFKNKALLPFLWKAASATTQPVFDKALEDMASINPKAVPWLLEHAKPEHWAEIHFLGRRYGHLTSNIAESLNLWLLEAREKPILAMFEQIRHQLMNWFTTRHPSEDKTLGLLVAKSANHLQSVTNNRARRYRSVPSIPGVLYEVKSVETRRNYIVDLVQHSCTCSIWQSSGYPCGHAISIILSQKDDPQHYVKSIFTIDAYKKTYGQPIIPLDLTNVNGDAIHSPPTVISDEEFSEPEDDLVLPPSTCRPPGRPPKRRILGRHDEVDCPKRPFKCSRCGEIGHNRTTCHEPINGG
jgi:zinc finger SWIM domain-containing protein 3